MSDLFKRVVVPVANPEDARATSRALKAYLDADASEVVVVHVIEKAGGAPDKAGVEQRQEVAEDSFDVVREELGNHHPGTEIRYGTDVAETIFDAAADHDATAIVITPRGGGRWVRLLTGDIALDIVTKTDRPVVVLPDLGDAEEGGDNPASEDPDDASGSGGGGAA